MMNIAAARQNWQANNLVVNWTSFLPAFIERLPDGSIGVFDQEVRLIATLSANWSLSKIAEILGAEYTPKKDNWADAVILKKFCEFDYGSQLVKLLRLL